jgi:hypothetical protein
MPHAVKVVGSVTHGTAALLLIVRRRQPEARDAVPVTEFERLDVPHAGLDGKPASPQGTERSGVA